MAICPPTWSPGMPSGPANSVSAPPTYPEPADRFRSSTPTRSAGWRPLPRRGCPPWPPLDQINRYVRPAIAGDREECYAITEEGAGSDVAAIEATARRDGDGYLLNGVKWHVTSFNTADFAFFQAKLDGGPHQGEHAMFFVDLPSPGVSVLRTPAYSHTISHHHPIAIA